MSPTTPAPAHASAHASACSIRPYLAAHLRRYPAMTPQDVAKLCYQAAHGAEHLLSDLDRARAYLERELEATPADAAAPLVEPISDDVARVHLAAWKVQGRTSDALFALFAATASVSLEGDARLAAYLAEATELIGEAQTPITPAAWQEFLAWYDQNGRPPIHHGAAFREAEHPAYRIVLRSLLREAELE